MGVDQTGGAVLSLTAVERVEWVRALHPASVPPMPADREAEGSEDVCEDAAIAHVLRGHLETTGPIAASRLAERLGLRPGLVEIGLARLEAEGFVLRGHFEKPGASDAGDEEQVCARRLLARIHSDSQGRLRASVEAVSAQEMMRFLLTWQHVAPATRLEGAEGVARVVEQLQGFDLAAGAWETEVLSSRVRDYQPEWIDLHGHSGRIGWLRLAPPTTVASASKGAPVQKSAPVHRGVSVQKGTPLSRVTPLSLVLRADLPWLLQAHRGETSRSLEVEGLAGRILALLESGGALFHSELEARLGARPAEVETALWELVALGRVGADGLHALRGLLGSRERGSRTRSGQRARRGLRRGLASGLASGAEGRWSRIPDCEPVEDADGLAEAVAEQLLVRWGIVFRDVALRESLALPWREIVWALRRLEARGSIRGGRFVAGFTGEQFALPEALECLARVKQTPRCGERISLSACDPLNLIGILTPGPRVPAVRSRAVVFVDGLPTEADPDPGGNEVDGPRAAAIPAQEPAAGSGVPTAGLVA